MSESTSGGGDASTDSDGTDIYSTVECPTCGRDDFKSNEGMRRHHAIAHGESLSKIKFECERCGDSFTREYAWTQRDRNTGRFCSQDCKNKTINVGIERREERNCPACGDTYETVPSNPKRFCSRDCAYGNREIDGAHTKECEICGGEFETGGPSKAARRVTCSRECRSEWYTGQYTGEDNWAWKGGYDQWYGENWPEQRAKARERDKYRCQVCQRHESEFDKELSVHHVFPVRRFDEPEEANGSVNLVTMCEPCHTEWEGLYLRPDTRDA